MYCRKCGKELGSNVKFCANCGEAVGAKSSAPKRKDTKRKISKKGVVIIGIIILLSIIVAIILVESYKTKQYKMTENSDLKFVLAQHVTVNDVCEATYEDENVVLCEDDVASLECTSQSDAESDITEYVVKVTFTGKGAKKFSDVTAEHVGECLSIIVRGRELCSPVIQTAITDGVAVIATGCETEEEAMKLLREILGE